MRRIFVSHPLTGDLKGNRKKADKICRYIVRKGFLPISPLHLFSFIDEETDELRERIMEVCYKLIDLSDEVWIYGDSEGCNLEREYAKKKGKKIVILYEEKEEEKKRLGYYKHMMQENKGVIL